MSVKMWMLVGGNVKWCSHDGKQGVPQKISIEFPRGPTIPLLGIYPAEMKKKIIHTIIFSMSVHGSITHNRK